MNFRDYKLKLSGKGIVVKDPREWLNDNIRLTLENVELHEVLRPQEDKIEERFGWVIEREITLSSDFTLHTSNGMRGESFVDKLHENLILDPGNTLSDITSSELIEVDISTSQLILDRINRNNFDMAKQFRKKSRLEDDGLIVVSMIPELVIIQTDENSLRIGDKGVYILDREDESLVLINEKSGITIINEGRSIVEINDKDNIKINGKYFDPEEIARKVTSSIGEAFSNFKL